MVRRGIFLLLAVAFGLGGWNLGNQATRIPQVASAASVDVDSNVTVYSQIKGSTIRFTWSLLSDGKVEINADAFAPSGNGSTTTVMLTGGAKLIFDDSNVRARLDDRDPGSANAAQFVDLEPGDTVVGRPEVSWRETANGRTEARLPDVWLASEEGPAGLFLASQQSELHVGVVAALNESIDSFSPSSVPGGDVRVLESRSEERRMGSRVYWALSPARVPGDAYFRADQPEPDLLQAVARMSEPTGVARAQQHLLISGALLGLAAAALFEVFATGGGVNLRRRSQPYGAAAAPAKPFSGHSSATATAERAAPPAAAISRARPEPEPAPARKRAAATKKTVPRTKVPAPRKAAPNSPPVSPD